ncbi:hypothetical protein GCM10023194_17690 [Planotetraspora phitsanulokensis]|uniref:Uncharacterized protein n=1 Tax=Planotetraspora phitsanulokensis TaxID=575192 RepID=A0A8J3U9Q8_9ACTN|nr:hypothetical protein Pph01_01330 [Planotetraspora phitsanulokensis]
MDRPKGGRALIVISPGRLCRPRKKRQEPGVAAVRAIGREIRRKPDPGPAAARLPPTVTFARQGDHRDSPSARLPGSRGCAVTRVISAKNGPAGGLHEVCVGVMRQMLGYGLE